MIGRLLALLYGLFAYVAFLAAFTYAIGFVANVGVPRGIDAAPVAPPLTALLIDLGLLGLFALQHSIMARPAFKRVWTTIVPVPVERSTFVLASSAALGFLYWQWQPLGGVVWDVPQGWARIVLYGLCAGGWLVVFLSTVLIDHFELFGLRQVWTHFLGRERPAGPFMTPGFYKVVRHPLYLGFLIAFWAAPTMTITHLLFAVMTTGYILIAIQLEERDLVAEHPEYATYRQQVPMLIPGRAQGR
jgi:methanethiol S-methyltransferase